ncbi:uncharacterized protein LOC107140716 isoform X8 [Marmota marmota marmota]|uniref:uncharacterized protein LOC107140716 isoform X8 n=1 Tax=Marmota marmota marmota TaxID=9994 RepID=UPI0020933F80|nr:uncharacterized protein LOC107140716 isoform X8 [Marmota marmota marmota]
MPSPQAECSCPPCPGALIGCDPLQADTATFSKDPVTLWTTGIRQAKVEIRLGILEIRLAAGSSPEGIMVNLGQLRGDHCSKPDRLQEKVAWEISWKPEKLYVILGQKLGGPLGWPPD